MEPRTLQGAEALILQFPEALILQDAEALHNVETKGKC